MGVVGLSRFCCAPSTLAGKALLILFTAFFQRGDPPKWSERRGFAAAWLKLHKTVRGPIEEFFRTELNILSKAVYFEVLQADTKKESQQYCRKIA
jgi:hypothetical protein